MSRYRLVKKAPWLGFLFRSWLVSNAYETLAFLINQRRIPDFRRTGLFNDLQFEIRMKESDYVARSFTSDKEFQKIFVRGVTGEDLSVPTLDVIRDAADIDHYAFPPHSVVKPTHMANEIIFVEDGPVSDAERARMKRWMKLNFGEMTGERHYLWLEPKIIIEPWLRFDGRYSNDYKVHVHQGRVTCFDVNMDRFEGGARHLLLDLDWKPFDVPSKEFNQMTPAFLAERGLTVDALKPAQFERMRRIAEAIGRYFPLVRVDFYTDKKDRLHVGEISHLSANTRFRFDKPEAEWAHVFGEERDPRAS